MKMMARLKLHAENHKALITQLMRFGIIGVLAATIHFTTVVVVVETTGMAPLMANILGFIIAFHMSYWGHRAWTFKESLAKHREAFPKLLLVQGFNFFANEALFFFFLQLHMPYKVALLLVVTILPIFTFLMSRFWVFA